MSFSPFDKRLLEEGLVYFDRPRLASLLELLGTTRVERVDALVTMLRHCPPEELEEMLVILDRAVERVTRERARELEAHQRSSKSAERRAQRRRSS